MITKPKLHTVFWIFLKLKFKEIFIDYRFALIVCAIMVSAIGVIIGTGYKLCKLAEVPTTFKNMFEIGFVVWVIIFIMGFCVRGAWKVLCWLASNWRKARYKAMMKQFGGITPMYCQGYAGSDFCNCSGKKRGTRKCIEKLISMYSKENK